MANRYHFQTLKSIIKVLLPAILVMATVLACNMPMEQQSASANVGLVGGGFSNGVTILYPADGAQLSVGDFVDIHSQIGDPSGISKAVLTINTQIERQDQLLTIVQSGDLYQPWQPAQPGTYILSVVLETLGGDQIFSNKVTVYVGELPPDKTIETPTDMVPSVTPTQTSTPTVITPTLTPTAENAMASSDQTVNCRSGPGIVYGIRGAMHEGETAPIVGQNNARTWWLVDLASFGTNCWVSGTLVNVSGNIGNIGLVSDPPTPTFTITPSNTPKPPPETSGKESAFSACHDYPDQAVCFSDPEGFGVCSWDTGTNKCQP
ncbi:MAG: hypothetical protein JEZ00_14110 [Anaerolineaceae bacterium]|nr:hypothetical protein [Anaerolineaceae bacterium]